MKYLLLLLLALQSAAAHAWTDSTRLSNRQATSNKELDSTSYYKAKSNTLQAQIDDKKDNGSIWPVIISGISLLVAVLAFRYTYFNYNREGSYKRVNFAAEVNKLQLANPDLRAMYDDKKDGFLQHLLVEGDAIVQLTGSHHLTLEKDATVTFNGNGTIETGGVKHPITDTTPLTTPLKAGESFLLNGTLSFGMANNTIAQVRMLTPDLEAKIRAFCFFLINNFEILFNNTKRSRRPEAKYWEAYFVDLMERSDRLCKQVDEVLNHKEAQFSEDYLEKLRSLHEKAKKKAQALI